MAESCFATLRTELVHQCNFATRAEAFMREVEVHWGVCVPVSTAAP
jgi:hypothetical protein